MGKKILSIIFCGLITLNLVGCDSVKNLLGKKENDKKVVAEQDIPTKPAEKLILNFDSAAKVSEAFTDSGVVIEEAVVMTDDFIETINNMVKLLDYKYEYSSKSDSFKANNDGSKSMFFEIVRNKEYTSKNFFNQDRISLIQNELKINTDGKTNMFFSVTFKDMDEESKLQLSKRDKLLLQAIWPKVNLDELQTAIDESYKKEIENSNGIIDIPVTSGSEKVEISVYPIVTNGMREINVMFNMNM